MGDDVLISAAQLQGILSDGDASPPRLLDVRWRLDQPDGRADYTAGHLPGAVFVDLATELADAAGPAEAGRHPLPEPETLLAAARRWGLHDGESIVVYDDWGSAAAARAWWLLRDAGVAEVRVLDGGLSAWRARGGELEEGWAEPEPGSVTLGGGAMPVLDADAAAALAEGGVLLDARAPERYRGETEPLDPIAGHIPGAVNAPMGRYNDAEGRLLPAAEIRAMLAGIGVSGQGEIGAYCGSGVSASHTVLALRSAGIDAALYPGSWSAWSRMPDRPVATGEQP